MTHPREVPLATGEWLRRYWLAGSLAVFMLLAVVLFLEYWNEPSKPAALLAFLAGVLLVGVTAEYARANQESLKLLREQWRRQQALGVKFSLRACQGRARVRVTNIGVPNVIVTRAVIRTPEKKPCVLSKHLLVRSGDRQGFYLPDQVWSGALQLHLEVTLHCEAVGQRSLETRAYTLFMTSEGKVHQVQKGLLSIWRVSCPACGRQSGLYMRTDGLADFADAFARQERLKFHLRESCPRHDSPWLLKSPPPASPFGPTQEVPAEWQDLPDPGSSAAHLPGRR
ncbi:MAG TPA: hypothetical protein VE825_09865 [Terriglobales bacterium]|jgi:hypothetical protein|nr:hypothetical protein [Terriglobales bacterium]